VLLALFPARAFADRPAGGSESMITEPSTLATDYMLGALSLWLAWRLRTNPGAASQRAVTLWSAALAAAAAGSFAGGTYHGFKTVLSDRIASAVWTTTTIAIGAAACLLLSAVLTAGVRAPARRWLLIAVWAQFAGYALWMLRHDAFVNVIVEYGSAMLVVVVLYIGVPALRRHPSARWIIAGIAVTFAAAAIQQSGFDVHSHLNHNDLQHLTQMVAVWLLYKGGAELRASHDR
jgi:hypothetical protein